MRIANRFTTLSLLIICGLFLCSGVSADANQYGIMRLSIEEIEERAQIVSQNLASTADIASLTTRSTPPSVDLLQHLAYDPKTRDQGPCGSCWVWAGTGAISINQKVMTEVYDELSIQYTTSLFNEGGTTGDFACYGGDFYTLSMFYLDEGNKRVIPVTNMNAGQVYDPSTGRYLTYADYNGGQPGGWEGRNKTSMPAENIVKTPYYSFTSMDVYYINFEEDRNVIVDNMKDL